MKRPLITIVLALALAGALTACGSDDPTPAAAETTPMTSASPSVSAKPAAKATASATPADDVVAISIAVDGKTVEPAPSRTKVPVDAKVRLTVTSDTANEIHVHGYDLYKDVAPGKPAVITFTADQKGLFEIETHESPVLILGQLQVQ